MEIEKSRKESFANPNIGVMRKSSQDVKMKSNIRKTMNSEEDKSMEM